MGLRYSARPAGEPLEGTALKELEERLSTAAESGLALLFSMRHDFPSEWAAFTQGAGELGVSLTKDMFPYIAQGHAVTLAPQMTLYTGTTTLSSRTVSTPSAAGEQINGAAAKTELRFATDTTVLTRTAGDAFLVVGFGVG